jgi:hypothetical protein
MAGRVDDKDKKIRNDAKISMVRRGGGAAPANAPSHGRAPRDSDYLRLRFRQSLAVAQRNFSGTQHQVLQGPQSPAELSTHAASQ